VVLLTVIFVVSSMVRESSDKGMELLLSLPMSRSTYYLGKMAGFAACGGLLAMAFSSVMLFWSPALGVAMWALSLVLEASLLAAISLFFVVALGQLVPSLAGVVGLYFLARVISAIQLISTSPLVGERNIAQEVSKWGIDAVALLMPPLDKVTQTAWLLYTPPSLREFFETACALLIYGALVVAAGLFDFHRKNL
jgi:ABC-type Na+ efflux pump permease subunit